MADYNPAPLRVAPTCLAILLPALIELHIGAEGHGMSEWGIIARRRLLALLPGTILAGAEMPIMAKAASAADSHKFAVKEVDVFGVAPFSGMHIYHPAISVTQ